MSNVQNPKPAEIDTTVEVDEPGAERSLTLTDGVVAIALTLLGLDLKPEIGDGGLPKSASSHDLAHYIGTHESIYLTFLVAFALIAQYWAAHHRIMRQVRGTTPGLMRANMLYLLGITLIPTTTFLNGTLSNPLANWIFAGSMVLISLSLSVMSHIVRRHHLDARGETTEQAIERRSRAIVNISIPIFAAAMSLVVHGHSAYFYFLFIAADLPGRLVVRYSRRHAAT